MEKYLNNWITIIDGIKNDNTYKASWGRAIIECVMTEQYEIIEKEVIIEEYFIVQKILKYYWNLNCFFKLSQGDYLVIEKITKEIQDDFYLKKKYHNPAWFNEMEVFINRNQIKFEKIIRRIMKLVNKNVAHRFLNHKSKQIKLYKLDLKTKSLRFKLSDIEIIKTYSHVLKDLINSKWALYLENYNNTPHLQKKVIDSEQTFLNRQNLRAFKTILVENYHTEGLKDFYTGKHLEYRDIRMAHVIPYDYIYNNDLWNLVVTDKASKPKLIPSQEDIEKLKRRNIDLLKELKLFTSREKLDLEKIVNSNLLDKCFIDLKEHYIGEYGE